MAIKEEQYDPGYEDAFGGAYGAAGPEEGQSNGHCTFSAAEKTGRLNLSDYNTCCWDSLDETSNGFNIYKPSLLHFQMLQRRRLPPKLQPPQRVNSQTDSGWSSPLPMGSQTLLALKNPRHGQAMYKEGERASERPNWTCIDLNPILSLQEATPQFQDCSQILAFLFFVLAN